MDQNTFMGLFIVALVILVPLFIACVTPLIKLNKSIQKLNDAIDILNESDSRKNKALDDVHEKIAIHTQYLIVDKKRLDNLSKRMHKIDNEEGFTDNVNREWRKVISNGKC